MFGIRRAFNCAFRVVLTWLVLIGVAARLEHAFAQQHQVTSAHFTPPDGCIPDPAIAAAGHAVQACIERFSPTHEFIISLRETRLRPSRADQRPDPAAARSAVRERVADLRATNQAEPGQKLLSFEHMATASTGFPPGADYCELVDFVQLDRRVPGYPGEEFRIWGHDFVCARADLSGNSVQLLDLRASERFRVATDDVKERFKSGVPMNTAFAVQRSLRFN